MNFKIFVALAGSAVLMAAADNGDTQSNNATKANSTTEEGDTLVSSPVTTLKPPINCTVGNCTGAGCYNKTSFGKSTKCQPGESCVLQVFATNFTMSCRSSTQCNTLEAKGTAACCDANNCIPDLAKAKANATTKNNGCVSLEMNMGLVLALMAIMLPKVV